jgi:hypothetical protein
MSGKPKHRHRLCESIRSSEGYRRRRQVTSSGGCHAPNLQALVGSRMRCRISHPWGSRNGPRRLCPDARLRSGRDGTELDQPERSSLIGRSQCVQPKCRSVRRHDPECAQSERDAVHLCSSPHRTKWGAQGHDRASGSAPPHRARVGTAQGCSGTAARTGFPPAPARSCSSCALTGLAGHAGSAGDHGQRLPRVLT